MASIKKNVRITHETVDILKGIFALGQPNFSVAINAMAESFHYLMEQYKPVFSREQWMACYAVYNGHAFGSAELEASMLPTQIWDGVQYDPQVLEFLGSMEQAEAFVAQCNQLSTVQRTSVLYHVAHFWNDRHPIEAEDDIFNVE